MRADELLAQVRDAINADQVPDVYQEDLTARANELVNAVNCPQPAEETDDGEDDDENDEKKKDKEEKEKEKEKKQDEKEQGDDDLPPPEEILP